MAAETETPNYRNTETPLQWQRLISLPIFPGMTPAELAHVVGVVRQLCRRHAVVERPKATRRGIQAEWPSLECGDLSPLSFPFFLSAQHECPSGPEV